VAEGKTLSSKYEWGILGYITFGRLWNAIKILTSYQISRVLKRPIVWGGPWSFSIEPTNHCNLKCPECPSGLGALTRPLGILRPEQFEAYAKSIKKHAFYVQLFFQGEPFVNKFMPELIRIAHKNKLYVAISTNGILLDDDRIDAILQDPPDKLIFSIDGLDEETYQNYRIGGTFSDAFAGLERLMKKKRAMKLTRPFVEFQFIVMKQNEHQLDAVFALGKQHGVNKVTLKTMQVYSKKSADHFLPTDEKYRRYLVDENGLRIKGTFRNECFALWRTSVITWDGKVVPCCFDKDAHFVLGSMNLNSFREIWTSKPYQDFRQSLLDDRSQHEMCRNCTEGVKINVV